MASLNLNNKSADYELSGTLTAEVIDIFGLEVDLIPTDQVNIDNIFNETTVSTVDKEKIQKIMVKPENANSFDDDDDMLSKFGFTGMSSINLFVSNKSLDNIFEDINIEFTKLVGDIIRLPSGKLFEVTNAKPQVEGVNNMFVYANQKNVFILACKPYTHNSSNGGVENTLIEHENELTGSTVDNLSEIFDLNIQEETYEDIEGETTKEPNQVIDPVFGDLFNH